MSDKKKISDLLINLGKQGWTVERRKKHIVVFPPDKKQSPVTIAITPSDHRAFANVKSMCRQRGAEL